MQFFTMTTLHGDNHREKRRHRVGPHHPDSADKMPLRLRELTCHPIGADLKKKPYL
jgi:hypothetical protein